MGKGNKIVLVLIAVLVILTGCAKDPQQGEPGGEAPTVLVLWHTFTGNERLSLDKELQKIMDNHLEVIIKAEYFNEKELVDSVYYAQAGGKGPDIIIARAELLNQIYAKGGLAPFAGTVQDDFEAASAVFKIGETYYAKAWLTDVPLFFYRKDMVNSLPTTLNELFTAPSGQPKRVLAIPKLSTTYLATFWQGAGGSVYSQGKAQFTSSANLQFATQLKTWMDNEHLAIGSQAVNRFETGEAQFLIDRASRAFELSRKNVPWASVPLTRFSGGKTLLDGTVGIANSVIKTDPKRLEKIAMIEDLLLSPNAEAVMHKAGNRLPASAAYYTLEEAQGAYYREVNTSLTQGWVLANNTWERQLLPLLDEAWNKVLTGTEPEQALQQAQTKAAKVLSH